jgi:hypothetical protein
MRIALLSVYTPSVHCAEKPYWIPAGPFCRGAPVRGFFYDSRALDLPCSRKNANTPEVMFMDNELAMAVCNSELANIFFAELSLSGKHQAKRSKEGKTQHVYKPEEWDGKPQHQRCPSAVPLVMPEHTVSHWLMPSCHAFLRYTTSTYATHCGNHSVLLFGLHSFLVFQGFGRLEI